MPRKVGPRSSKSNTTSLFPFMRMWLTSLAVKDSKKSVIPTDFAMVKPKSSLVTPAVDLPSLFAH